MTLTLAAVFTDGMVLQREMPIPIWGSAPTGAEVTVTVAGATAKGRADDAGHWMVSLPPMCAGGPWTLTVCSNGEELRHEPVYCGEVWLAGGQSNMELPLKDARNGRKEVQNSANPYLHFYQPAKVTTSEEAERLEHSPNAPAWKTVAPETAGDLSAVAYFAARTLSEHLNSIHIGIIVCCWGGTYAHCWIGRDELARFPEGQRRLAEYEAKIGQKSDEIFAEEQENYQKQVDAWNAKLAAHKPDDENQVNWLILHKECGLYPWPPPAGRTSFQRPGNLYDSMLSRVVPYALRGFWYYQGEQDEEWPEDYYALLTSLIRRWRQDWKDPEKPFLLLQLPMFISREDAQAGDPMRWPVLRKAQAEAARTVPNVEMAVLADCGELDNIHPTDKRTPGTRLGLLALESVYHLPVVGKPPVCVKAWREGEAALLQFEHTGGGLILRGRGFLLAGENGGFLTAYGQVVSPDTVRVTAFGVEKPTAVRYAWHSCGPAGLYGGTGLAAAPLERTL